MKELLRKFGLEYFNKYYSIYRGIVVENNDPEKRGRLILKVPQVYGDNATTYALPKGSFLGQENSIINLPKNGDNVWVQFECGDSRFPVWESAYLNNGKELNISSVDDFKINHNNNSIQIKNDNTLEISIEKTTKLVISKDSIVFDNGENSGLIKINELKTQLAKVTARIDGIINALNSGVGVPMDGGNSLIAGIKAQLSAIVDVEDYSDIENTTIKH